MSPRETTERTFETELRSVLAILQCLSEYASERGDNQSAAILHNTAALLELSMPAPEPRVQVRTEVLGGEYVATAFA
ncbi:hypothetical protein [Muricoccus aerilatus]|uniref:hypothetical protein n=1 Tax=Muricoccus aerilatus TaxID=452982 RepID=UPI0005C181F4|nr:hypothetical protein [Roseomonas aerilata]